MSDIHRSHPCENWMMISHHFPHLQTLFGLHPRLSWEKKGQIQLDNMHEHGKLLRPLAVPMVEETSRKVQQLITVLHNEHHINEMTEKWLCQTPKPPRIPVFYTLRKIHKPTWETYNFGSVRSNREVVSICCQTTPAVSTTTEVVSQRLIQSTDYINFIERTKVPENAILVSMDITSLYTNIPQEREYIRYARHTTLYKDTPPIRTRLRT